MYYLPENFEYEHRGLVISDEYINNILQQKNIFEDANNVTEAHEDLQDYFWHVVDCEKLPFRPTTWKEATMIFKRIIEKASIWTSNFFSSFALKYIHDGATNKIYTVMQVLLNR